MKASWNLSVLLCLYVNLFKDLFLLTLVERLFSKADAKVYSFLISCKSLREIFYKKNAILTLIYNKDRTNKDFHIIYNIQRD